MEINRTNIFDFAIGLDETEFQQVKNIADCDNISIEQAFINVVETGLHTEEKTVTGKE